MSPFNVHVNRAPCDGKVLTVKHSPGIYMAAYKDDASMKNENIVMVLEGKEGKGSGAAGCGISCAQGCLQGKCRVIL